LSEGVDFAAQWEDRDRQKQAKAQKTMQLANAAGVG